MTVHAGKWYFEVKLESNGQAQVGWCTQDYDGSGNAGDCWAYDGNRLQKLRNGNGITYGQSWSSGDVIGVSLTMGDAALLRFSRNGHDLGKAYGSSEMGKARNLSPFCLLSRNMKMTFNFGASAFVHPQHGFNQLHSFLDDKHMVVLGELFHKYCNISNEVQEDEDFELAIFEAGTDAFMADLGITDDMDPGIFIIGWKLSCCMPWVISKAEWMNGFMVQGASSIAEMKKKLTQWRKDLKASDEAFAIYYNWVFDLMRGDKRILEWDQSKILWQVVFEERKWPLFGKFLAFLEETKTKAINQDLWAMLLTFSLAYPKGDLSGYDMMDSAYPGKIDDFVEWVEENQ